ncbi:Hypothetical protein IALB_1082 [Ignavibacterium album JCM 16511]|uniref:Cytochrome C Planctomycete-type domain-containing protein n=1 Tax=Ignavibacterium album (strain DSM 19864 / JCM 16511 / NBRC 101810 / Mat9-16) TaxID=945713 RepID=I0AII6_IGNAJ|nr:hypothetical protein [Ignavibacterium album]AFH48793.1 Hypothetical protein IALB_1082 [Ignavibacterium album JCM 16511]
MKKILFLILSVSFISIIILSCGEGTTDPPTGIDENNNGFESLGLADVFVNSCASSGCHSGNNPAGDISMENYSSLIKGAVHPHQGHSAEFEGEVLIPFNSSKSLLYQMIEGNVSPISPHENLNLTAEQKSRIKNWIDNGAKNFQGKVPFSNPTFRVFVCNQSSDKISVIDGDFNVVSRIVDVSVTPTTDSPHMVKEFGEYYYVTLISAGKFLKIRKSDNQIVSELSGIEKAGMIQITSDGSIAFVSRSSTSPSIFNSVYAIRLSDMSLLQEITLPVTGVPHAIALTPNDSILYVANLTKDRISKVNAKSFEFIDDIILPSGTEPMQTSCSPDGDYLYISARGTNKLLVLSVQTDSVISEIDVNTAPMHIAVSSDGNKIFVATMGNHIAGDHGNVEVIEKSGESWSKLTTITDHRFSMPHGCDISADNNYLFVSSRNTSGMFTPKFKVVGEGKNGNLAIIDTRTIAVIKVLELEEYPSGLVVEK